MISGMGLSSSSAGMQPYRAPGIGGGSRPQAGQTPLAGRPPGNPFDAQRKAILDADLKRFSAMEQRLMAEDADTRRHEAAHKSAAGPRAGSISYGFQTMSMKMADGSNRSVTYAASGSVPISLAAVPPPEAGRGSLVQAQADLQLAYAGATAPHNMSSADSAIASRASAGLSAISALLAKSEPHKDSLRAAMQGPKGQRLNVMA